MHADRRVRGLVTTTGIAALVACGMALSPAEAHAFCRTRTVPTPPGFNPSLTEGGCFEQGLPLYHASQCVPYRQLAKDSPIIPRAVISNTLARAFDAWSEGNPTCAPGFTAVELGPTNATEIVGYTTGERGNNVVGVVDGPWKHSDGADTLSLATLTFNVDTGEIYDADLEIRGDVTWSFTAVPAPNGYDFDAVMTHETGHFLGLAHTAESGAVMFASYTPGSVTQRTLKTDDQNAICAIYPDRQTRVTGTGIVASTACNLSPSTPGAPGTPGAPCGDPVVTRGCAVGAPTGSASPGGTGWLGLLLGGVALVAWRARKRRA